ncbi:major facilitator superfamily domain-containing protein [Mycena alexandri]|uniref:Major facilitator superfamily domain-containing protein n=1 Tax=Mycena alexandri TaxID=1745969 RepID=A0AAD6T4H0_9AGAR|nr:major facilitator superfamily domain-containing protein [Mycena alexandri]
MSAPTLKERLRGVSLIFACGTALFSDGYGNGVIGSVNTLLKRIYGVDAFPTNYSTTLNSSVFAGTILGMLTFGWISDRVGRKFGMMSAAGMVAFFSALSAASSGANHSLHGLLAMLIVCRFFLGIGIGAEYPTGSVACSEQTEGKAIAKNAQHRWFALATNCMIDLAWCVAAFVPLLMFWICGPNHLRAAWRLSLGLGFFPAIAVFAWRWNMEEPELYKNSSMRAVKIPYMLVLRKYGVRLAAISFTWFLYDFIVYPFGIYSSTVIDTITGGDTSLTTVFGWNVVINLFYMPGTIGGAFIVDYLGPKYTMILGLLLQALFGFIMSGLYSTLKNHIAAFAVMYGIFLCFGELGPGNNLGLLASKSSPTAVRGQFYGVAAAVGKVGAFVGTYAFPPMIEAFTKISPDKGNTGPFWIGSGLAILSALITFFFIAPLDHDGMAKEDAILQFRAYLEENGLDTSGMGFPEETETRESIPEELDEKEKVVV